MINVLISNNGLEQHVTVDQLDKATRQVSYCECIDEMIKFANAEKIIIATLHIKYDSTHKLLSLVKGIKHTKPCDFVPLEVSICLVAISGCKIIVIPTFNNQRLLSDLQELLNLPIMFVGHNLQFSWYSLWQIGVEPPSRCWDTYIAERSMSLGVFNSTDRENKKKFIAQQEEFLSLGHCCLRYRVPNIMLNSSHSVVPEELKSSTYRPHLAARKLAFVLAKLFVKQSRKAEGQGVLKHLQDIEMRWVMTNARMGWHGMLIDQNKGMHAKKVARRVRGNFIERLNPYGIENPRSQCQLKEYFRLGGLLDYFWSKGTYRFDREILKENIDLDGVVEVLLQLSRLDDIENLQLLNPLFISEEGRVHPMHIQLGAATGRQSCKYPFVLGLSREQRNLIVPSTDHAICEIDYSQIEPGVAGVVFDDKRLIKMYNTGDVYTAMADLFLDGVSVGESLFSTYLHNETRLKSRNLMKVCTLGLIYGLSAFGLSRKLRIDEASAASLMDKFNSMFPDLINNQEIIVAQGHERGYVETATGLRRYVSTKGSTGHDKNWMKNHPVQGSAAVVFKDAGNHLDKVLKEYNAHIILPLHDSFVVEAPIKQIDDVVDLVSEVMCSALKRHFPELAPQVSAGKSTVNWNKDGEEAALDQWTEGIEKLL